MKTEVFQDLAGNPYRPAIDVLAGLGIVDGLPNGGFEPAAPVTREQLAAFVVRLLGYQTAAQALVGSPAPFSDTANIDLWAVGDVNVVQSLGLMSGFPDGTFRPKATVSETSAAAVLVRVLNGGNYANGLGQWPGNYLQAARSLGLLKAIKLQQPDGSAPIRRDELAQMLFNAGMAQQLTYDASGNAILPAAGKQLFASTGWTVALNAIVTGVGSGAISFGSTNLPLANQVTLIGTQDQQIGDLQGQTVDYTMNAAGRVNSVEIATTTSLNLSLNTSRAAALAAAARLGGSVYEGMPFVVTKGTNFFWLVLSNDGVLPFAKPSIPIQLNGESVPLATAVPTPADDQVRATLDAEGAVIALDVTHYNLDGLLATGTEGQWASPGAGGGGGPVGTGGGEVGIAGQGGVAINFDQPGVGFSAVLLAPGSSIDTYLNGNGVAPQTLYDVVQTDLAAGVYPVLAVAGQLSRPFALSVWDEEVTGTVVQASKTAPGMTQLRISTSASQTVSLPVGQSVWQAAGVPPTLQGVTTGWFGSAAAQAGKPGVYAEEDGAIVWSWPLPASLGAGERVVELTSAQQDAKGNVTWTVDYRGNTYTVGNDAGRQLTLDANPGSFYLLDVQPDGGVTAVQPLTLDSNASGTPFTYTVELVTIGRDASGKPVLSVTLGSGSVPLNGPFATSPATTLRGPLVYGAPATVVSPYEGTLQAGAAVHVWYDPAHAHLVIQAIG